jgi:hypothetical protein
MLHHTINRPKSMPNAQETPGYLAIHASAQSDAVYRSFVIVCKKPKTSTYLTTAELGNSNHRVCVERGGEG